MHTIDQRINQTIRTITLLHNADQSVLANHQRRELIRLLIEKRNTGTDQRVCPQKEQ